MIITIQGNFIAKAVQVVNTVIDANTHHNSIGRAMYYTTLTVVVGFATLTLSNFTPLLYFGVLTVVAMIAAVAGALLLLPQLILIFRPFGKAQS